MNKEIEIPEGYEAKIDGNKVIFVLKESEDEKVRKTIGAAICGTTAETVLEANGVKLVDALAYLEKQKEQNLEDIEDKAARKYMKLDKFTLANMLAERDKTNAEVIEAFESIERKPAEWSGLTDKDTAVQTLLELVSLLKERNLWPGLQSSLTALAKDIESLHIVKPAEWSDDDEKVMDNIIFSAEHHCYLNPEETQWLKSLRHQTKREWSEEDKHRLEQAINALSRNGYYVLGDWLQFLPERFNPRPKEEWSKEDDIKIHFLKNLIQYQVRDDDYCFGHNGRDYVSKQEAIEMLSSLRPQPHWKPSEEQMKALWEVEDRMRTDKAFTLSNRLASLYNDLEKL